MVFGNNNADEAIITALFVLTEASFENERQENTFESVSGANINHNDADWAEIEQFLDVTNDA